MTYAYDDSIQMPVMDLYDTQMMLASINAARDMYKSRLEEIKDFKKQYGDFYSPILKDMEEYNNTIIKPILDAISSMYKNGIDPLRNAEAYGRINSIINSVNPGRVNFLKQRALNAEKMYESINKLRALNAFNPEFAKAIGEDPLSWDSNYIGTSSATPYLDYETKYGHLFDKMEYEYDPEASKQFPGMYVMTKNKGRMRDILNSTINDLSGDPLFLYDLKKYIDTIPNQNNKLSAAQIRQEAQNILLSEIVNRNYKGGMKMQEDPIAKQLAENNRLRLQFMYNEKLLEQEHQNKLEEIRETNALKSGGPLENYFNIISLYSAGARIGLDNTIMQNYVAKNAKNKTVMSNLASAVLSKDPNKIKHYQLVAFNYFLVGNPKQKESSPYRILMNLSNGQGGVYEINNILGLLSIKGDNLAGLDKDVLVLAGFGLPDEDGWQKITRGSNNIITPHQMMTNILLYNTGGLSTIKNKKTNKYIQISDIILKIKLSATDDESWWLASTDERLGRTDYVQPLHEYISAPDENGIYHVYSKVAIKQGARLFSPGSWVPQGEHEGFWVQTTLDQLPNGLMSSNSKPTSYGFGVHERKTYTNAAVKDESANTGN